MKTTKMTAADCVQKQHATILEAIRLLQDQLNEMTASVSPETESWADVSRFAHVSDAAKVVIESLGE